jgi:hypothetical protein
MCSIQLPLLVGYLPLTGDGIRQCQRLVNTRRLQNQAFVNGLLHGYGNIYDCERVMWTEKIPVQPGIDQLQYRDSLTHHVMNMRYNAAVTVNSCYSCQSNRVSNQVTYRIGELPSMRIHLGSM